MIFVACSPSASYCGKRSTRPGTRPGAAMMRRGWLSRIPACSYPGRLILPVGVFAMEEVLTTPGERPAGSGPRWWEDPASLRTCLLLLDGQVGAVVNAERHGADPAAVSGEVAGALERIAQQMGLGAGDGVVQPSNRAPGLEPVKPGFTREAGSFRRQVPPHAVPDSGV